jgi:hypothetical protein
MNRFKSNLQVVAVVLLLTGGTFVFANGQNEAPAQPGPNAAVGQAAAPTVAKDLTAVTGRIQIVNRIHPVITGSSATYELIVPRFEVYQAGVKEGQTISVKGYRVEGVAWGPYVRSPRITDNTPMLLVSSANIDGKSYDLRQWADRFKSEIQDRDGYGPMYGHDRGFGPMMGPGRGHGPQTAPGFGPGMGYRFQGSGADSQ